MLEELLLPENSVVPSELMIVIALVVLLPTAVARKLAMLSARSPDNVSVSCKQPQQMIPMY